MMEAGCPQWAAEWLMGHKEELDSRYSSPSGEKMKNTYYMPFVNSLLIDTAEVIITPQEDITALRELQSEMKLMREKEKEKDFAINKLMKISLELKERLDPEDFEPDPLPAPPLNKSLNNIESAVQDFDVQKAIEEAERKKALK